MRTCPSSLRATSLAKDVGAGVSASFSESRITAINVLHKTLRKLELFLCAGGFLDVGHAAVRRTGICMQRYEQVTAK